jgi:hypothetical protein
LASAGRGGEVRQQYEAGQRALSEVGSGSGPLLRAWRAAQASVVASVARHAAPAEFMNARRLSIAVLSFANLSDDPEQQYFADGITGDPTTDLLSEGLRRINLLTFSRNTNSLKT